MMIVSDRMRLFAFDFMAPTHLSAGLWRHGDDRGHRYQDLSFWTEYAQLLEAGCFDGVFFADHAGYHDVYELRHHGLDVLYDHPYAMARRFASLDHLTGGRVGWNLVTSYAAWSATPGPWPATADGPAWTCPSSTPTCHCATSRRTTARQ
jgi:long-chain alkane monooxygenase